MNRVLVLLSLFLILLSEGRYGRRNRQQQNDGPNRDFYKILGVKKRATSAQIKKAYRKLSRQYHPDKNKDEGAEDKYKDIVAAYECLSSEDKRRVFDQGGESGLQEWEKQQQSGGGGFGDIFDFFGGGRRRRGNDGMPRGPDTHIKLAVSLKTLYIGEVVDFDYVRAVMCANWDECEIDDRECEGPGIRAQTRTIGPGFVQKFQQQDDRCIARGKRYNPHCSACPNGATEPDSIPLTLEIDPGMKHGDTIKFEEVADETIGHTPGDLIIELNAGRHEHFTRKGDDLHLTLGISLKQALTGFTHKMDHLDGHEVTISPPNVLHCNSVYRLRGEGMPIKDTDRKGDMVVTFNIDFPSTLSSSQKSELKRILP